jgi:hypothetical protein
MTCQSSEIRAKENMKENAKRNPQEKAALALAAARQG